MASDQTIAGLPATSESELQAETARLSGEGQWFLAYDLAKRAIEAFPRNAAFLKALCQELKRACGTGGAVDDGAIELQGDLRDRVRALLKDKGFLVKG